MKIHKKRLVFFYFSLLLIVFIGGCIKPLQVFPQSITKDDVTINVEIIRDFKWYSLAKDIIVLNLEVINNSNEGVWIYPLSKSVLIDYTGRQYVPIREFYYQRSSAPKVSFEFSFRSNEPPSFSISLSSDSSTEKEIMELIRTYELLKFKDGKVFPGARVSGILAFYAPYYRYPLRFIIPEVFWENSFRKYDFEFIIGR